MRKHRERDRANQIAVLVPSTQRWDRATNPWTDQPIPHPHRPIPLRQPIPLRWPTLEPIRPLCEQPTPRLTHPRSDPLLDRAATFRLTHHVHRRVTPMNRSLSLSPFHNWSCDFEFFVLIFFFLCCLYILILCNNICLDTKKMWETW